MTMTWDATAVFAVVFFNALHSCWMLEVPVVQPFQIPKSLRIGQKLLLVCAISQGDVPMKFRWYHDGRELPTLADESTNQYSSVYIVKSISASDLGNYTCTVTNAAGSDSYTATLEVEAPPAWTLEPRDTTVTQGNTASIPCHAAGFPKPKISWIKDEGGTGNDFMPVLPDARHTIFDNGTLVISRTTSEDGGYYKCEAHNGIDPPLSKIMKLTIQIPPRVVESFQVVNVRKGEAAVLKCQGIGDTPVTMAWKKNSISLDKTKLERYELIQKETPTGVMSELLIRESERGDAGIFSCIAKNSVGEQEGKVELVIAEPPSAPKSLSISDVTSRTARLAWSPALSPSEEPIVSYMVRYWRNAGGSKKLHEFQVVNSETAIMLKDLRPGTSYSAQVFAQNVVGLSEPSKTTGFRTNEEVPSVAPIDVRAEAVGEREISVSWKAPPHEEWNGILKGYYVGHRPFASSAPFTYQTVSFRNALPDDGFIISGLEKGAKYSIVVKAFNAAGYGPLSNELVVTTFKEEPLAAPMIGIMEVAASTIQIKWTTLKQKVSPILHYLLQYRRESGDWASLYIPGSRSFFTIRNLEQGKHYEMKLASYNLHGRGNFSRAMSITTDSGYIGETVNFEDESAPIVLQPHLVIPLAASFVVIVTAVVVAWACYKKHLIEQQQAAANPPIPPDQMYPYNRNSLAQSDGYCDISRIPLYLQPNGMVQSPSMARRPQEEAYDTPWDTSQDTVDRNMAGNYTRLKNGPHINAVRRMQNQ